MTIRTILTVDRDPLSSSRCPHPWRPSTTNLRALMDDMLETMYAAPGIGLAAIQIGVPKRVIVMDLAKEGEPKQPRYFVNPEITSRPPTSCSSMRRAACRCPRSTTTSSGPRASA